MTVTTFSPPGSTSSSNAPTARSSKVPDAATIVREARAAYGKATSAHMHAMIQDGGETQVVDIRGAMDGSNQELTVEDSTGGRATVRTVDGKRYIKGNRDFWTENVKADAAAVRMLTDKWVLAPPSSTASFKKLTISSVLDSMVGPSAISASDTDGMRTYAATEQDTDLYVALAVDPSKQDIDTLKIVAADPHNITEVVSTSSGSGSDGTADFDGWNTQPTVTVPEGYVTLPGSGATGPVV